MRVLVVCQYYFPEPFRITDICEELVKRGHEVTVITGIPNYPMGKIYSGYSKGQNRDETINGVNIHRCFTVARRKGNAFRFLNYYSFSFSSKAYVSKLKDNYDVVFVNQLSPVMMANSGIKYKNRYGKKLVLYCLDLWPESLVSGGIKRKSFIYRFFYKISKRIYNQADTILTTSKQFESFIAENFGVSHNKIKYLPQYAEDIFSPEACKKQPNEYIDLLFAGNIGHAQNVQTIIRAANEARNNTNIRWHIVGDGSDLENCINLAKQFELDSVVFHGRKQVEEMPAYYALADAMLVTMQDDPVLSLTLPGKVQTYMAAGKPILGSINGETAAIISESACGYCSPADSPDGLAKISVDFANNKDREEMGKKARKYYENSFTKESFFSQLDAYMSDNI